MATVLMGDEGVVVGRESQVLQKFWVLRCVLSCGIKRCGAHVLAISHMTISGMHKYLLYLMHVPSLIYITY